VPDRRHRRRQRPYRVHDPEAVLRIAAWCTGVAAVFSSRFTTFAAFIFGYLDAPTPPSPTRVQWSHLSRARAYFPHLLETDDADAGQRQRDLRTCTEALLNRPRRSIADTAITPG
jgi:hypothetical protein